MNRTPKGSSYLAGMLDVFRGKPRKVTATTPKKLATAKTATTSAARAKAKQAPAASADTSPYRAAEIACEYGACYAAAAIADKRFLLRDVPRIPLADCTSPRCKCSYVRHSDRRNKTSNRRAEFSQHTKQYASHGNTDRRQKLGRRGSDRSSLVDYDFGSWATGPDE